MLLGPAERNRTSVSGSLTDSLLSNNPFIAPKRAVLAPMPRASEMRTTAVQPLACSIIRAASRRSLNTAAGYGTLWVPSIWMTGRIAVGLGRSSII